MVLAQAGDLPELFENPEKIIRDLAQILTQAQELAGQYLERPTVENAFLLSCRMEFNLLHPALAELLLFANTVSKDLTLVNLYDRHLEEFINAFREWASNDRSLQLLGETLDTLWKQNRQLARLGTTDELTGVLNRRGFFNTVKPLAALAERSGEHVGIIMVDVDNFKEINDAQGHPKGDQALRFLSQTLQDQVRLSDVVGRYGGEEFILFFPSVSPGALLAIAEKIRSTVENESKQEIPVTISLGVDESVPKGDAMKSIFDMIVRADKRLYQAKHLGKNRVVADI
ncbi:MAG: hypothetical protein A2293_07480 [Elusimicrobia bacterium RIFOXYB2_FULL_49_7]|nr:MAG: hypothetical protein A2293_07480 [Elusimicrobia bacterium RIFOXYB2_FULL_49_7]